jgi:hypothetical protein
LSLLRSVPLVTDIKVLNLGDRHAAGIRKIRVTGLGSVRP